jgi:hypothetical protein
MTYESAASGTAPDSPGHVDPDRLADLAEGLLDGSAAGAVRTHLASCELCAEDFALITLDSGLADFLAPEPIPAEVVARVEAALYREPPLRTPASAASASHTRSQHAARPSRARRFKIAFGTLASVGLLAGGVFAGVSMFSSGGVTTESASSKSDGSPAAGYLGGSGTSQNAPKAASAGATAEIQQQAVRLLAALKSSGPGGSSAASPGRPDSALRTPAVADTCSRNPRPTDTLLASAPTVYQGRAAQLFVYAKAGDSTRADVVVVDGTCDTSLQGSGPAAQTPRPAAGNTLLTPFSTQSPQVLVETDITRP